MPLNPAKQQGRIPQPALALLALMMSAGPFGDTEYTPAMPAIAHALDTGYGMVQVTMASYLAGSALGQLCWGPASDRLGRRPIMVTGATVLLAGSVLCLLSWAISPLVAGRLVQGVGACAGGVITDAAVRDAFAADRRQRIYAYLNAAFALAPAIGPIAGAYVHKAFGWRANFAVLVALAALLLLLVWRYLPETNPNRTRSAATIRRIWRTYLAALTRPRFVLYAALGGCCVGVVYTALIGAPDLVINRLGLGSQAIVIVSASILAAFVVGAGACALLTNRVDARWIIASGLFVLAASSLALLTVGLVSGKHGSLADYLTPIATCFVGVGLVIPVSTAKAMAPFGDSAGAAASLLGAVRMGIAALAATVMSVLHRGAFIDEPIVFLGLTAGAVALFVWLLFACRHAA